MFLGKRFFDRVYALAAPDWAFNDSMQAIRNGFLLCLPLVVAGAVATLINNFPLAAYQDVMSGLFGENWKRLGELVWQGTFGILSLPMLVGISYHLVVTHNQSHPATPISPLISALVALSSLMVIISASMMEGEQIIPWMGTQGLFVSMIVALCATRIFLKLASIKRLQMLIYSEGTDAAIPQAFSCLIPGVLTAFLFSMLYLLFYGVTGNSTHQIIHDFLLYPFLFFQNVINTEVSFVFLSHVFWFFGIHGTNVLDAVTHDIFGGLFQANVMAKALGQPYPYILTKPFLDIFVFMGGSGSSICLLLALFIASKNDGSRRLAKISVLPGVFNINEILLFGLPVILNPVFLTPFVLTPLVLMWVSLLAVYFGWVPPLNPLNSVEWTTPPILGGFLATDSVAGSLLQCFNLVLGTLIYIPFVKISDKVKEERQRKAMNALMEIACSNLVGPSGKKCLDRDDEIGILARVLALDLERALKKDEGLYLEYQPLVDHITGRVISAEALVRWRHPVYGLIPAPIMVAISEDADFMPMLGLWVFREACAERAQWHQEGLEEHFKTSVNVSVRQLGDASLPDKFVQYIEHYQLKRPMIGIEVTESIALDPEALHNRVLKEIHDLGFVISIDDFGMGHSSLVYLKYFPVDILKIDKALSKDVAASKTCVEIISTIVDLCRALEVKIVVEFVENQEQIHVLRQLGCHIFQGYFYSPPLAGKKMLDYALKMNAAPIPCPEPYLSEKGKDE